MTLTDPISRLIPPPPLIFPLDRRFYDIIFNDYERANNARASRGASFRLVVAWRKEERS